MDTSTSRNKKSFSRVTPLELPFGSRKVAGVYEIQFVSKRIMESLFRLESITSSLQKHAAHVIPWCSFHLELAINGRLPLEFSQKLPNEKTATRSFSRFLFCVHPVSVSSLYLIFMYSQVFDLGDLLGSAILSIPAQHSTLMTLYNENLLQGNFSTRSFKII